MRRWDQSLGTLRPRHVKPKLPSMLEGYGLPAWPHMGNRLVSRRILEHSFAWVDVKSRGQCLDDNAAWFAKASDGAAMAGGTYNPSAASASQLQDLTPALLCTSNVAEPTASGWLRRAGNLRHLAQGWSR